MSGGYGAPPGFQWDEAKNRINIQKHRIAFREAVRIFEKPTLDRIDTRKTYQEQRTNSLGDLNGLVVLNITHTERNGDIRLISARAAKASERKAYYEFVRDLESEPEAPAPAPPP